MTDTLDKAEPVLGQPMRRKEDARLITGQTQWTDNVVLPGMLHMAVLRSPMAHARIARVDVEPARQLGEERRERRGKMELGHRYSTTATSTDVIPGR